MKNFFLLLLLSVSFLWANPLHERLKKAQKGDFLVTEQGKTKTLLRVHEANYPTLVLEEISFPSTVQVSKIAEWILQKAPGHTNWVMYEIDLEKKALLECFSFSRGCFLQPENGQHLLQTFLNLSFEKVLPEKRRKIGPSPLPGESDYRPFWKPPLKINGQKVPSEFSVYSIVWPKDTSPLSEKVIELYFDAGKKIAFPAWIQVHAEHISVFSKVIDAGSKLPSFYSTFPRRGPSLLKMSKEKSTYLLNIPKYCLDFDLIIEEDAKAVFTQQDFTLTHQEKETYLLKIKKPVKKELFIILIPKKHPHLYLPLS